MLRGLEVSSLTFICLHELSECKGHSVGTRALEGHASVLNVGFRVSSPLGLAFSCTLLDLGSIQLFGFLRLDPKNGLGQVPIVWFVGVVVPLCWDPGACCSGLWMQHPFESFMSPC